MNPPAASTLKPVRFHRDAWGQLVMQTDDGQQFEGVVVARAFPISDPDHWISICDIHGHEILAILNMADMPNDLRKVIEAELAHREFVPVIERILSATTQEPSDWVVETDRGRTSFQLNNEDDVRRLEPDQAMVVDSHGIRYFVPSVERLDGASRRILEHFL